MIGGPQLKGSLRLSNGELTALPVLDQIAVFTRTQQFRRLTLTNASGDFEQQGEQLRVTKFIAESEGLIRMEGAFTVEAGMIDGAFLVGVTPGSLQWLPGAQGQGLHRIARRLSLGADAPHRTGQQTQRRPHPAPRRRRARRRHRRRAKRRGGSDQDRQGCGEKRARSLVTGAK